MAELSGVALAQMQTAAAAGLVICLVMAGAFATLGFVTHGEQDRRQAALDTERMARISALLRENEDARLARVAPAARSGPALEPGREPALPAAGASDADVPDEAPLIAEGTLADLFAAAGPLPEAPPELAAILSPPPRRLGAAEATALEAALADQAGRYTVEVVTAPEAEARLYALQLTAALRGAGIDARGPVAVLTTLRADGLLVSAEADADGPGAAMLGALQTAGLAALPTPRGTADADALTPDGTDVRIYVGAARPASPPARSAEPREERVMEDA